MDVSDFFFGARGRGRGSPRCQEVEERFFTENPRRGGFAGWLGGGRGARGQEGVCEKIGGGVNIFFRARNSYQVNHSLKQFLESLHMHLRLIPSNSVRINSLLVEAKRCYPRRPGKLQNLHLHLYFQISVKMNAVQTYAYACTF